MLQTCFWMEDGMVGSSNQGILHLSLFFIDNEVKLITITIFKNNNKKREYKKEA